MADIEGGTPPMVVVRRILWMLVAVAAVFGVILAVGGGDGSKSAPAASAGAAIGGPFTLTAADGSTLTDRTLKGRPFAIFFGFTRCPDVCPTSLARMAQLREQLGPDGMKFDIVFVSVDPQHDRPADIGSYVALFKTPIIGATGTDAQLAQIQKEYGVYVRKVPIEGGDYTVDHTAAIYLMDKDGHFVTTIDYHENDKTALEKLKRIIA
ncbi:MULTISPECIES: SCO family protein [unclassified Sphingopyxis]|jgi:protein SCO1/2|uniref:SCO family protein n=1 Tax=unclassified Sphingopyxis TaxID=2614943 RepID=UPI00086F93B2|nr:SCO family protein [Sphingopyxis sp. SCN 67-31]ODU24679.1 MAG: electron transporter SenC [Sphingopyxis sp. SCN 67-31]